MTPLCAAIVRDHQVRKSRAQKAAFRELVKAEMRKEGVLFREERAKGLIENVNLVYGNLATAEFVFGAHYDTCAELPFPNLAAPLNIPLSILMQAVSYTHLDVYKRQVTPSAHAGAQAHKAKIKINANNLRMFRPPVHPCAMYPRMIIPHICREIATAL